METSYIVHIASHHIAERDGVPKRYSGVARAKAAMARSKLRDGSQRYPEAEYTVMSASEYREKDVMVETYNILNPSAGPIMIRKSQLGTCVDPGTERYHCM